MAQNNWFAIVADKDILDEDGKLEYSKGDVISYGSVVGDENELKSKGKRIVPLGKRDREPDFTKEKWDPTTEKIRAKTSQEIADEQAASKGGK